MTSVETVLPPPCRKPPRRSSARRGSAAVLVLSAGVVSCQQQAMFPDQRRRDQSPFRPPGQGWRLFAAPGARRLFLSAGHSRLVITVADGRQCCFEHGFPPGLIHDRYGMPVAATKSSSTGADGNHHHRPEPRGKPGLFHQRCEMGPRPAGMGEDHRHVPRREGISGFIGESCDLGRLVDRLAQDPDPVSSARAAAISKPVSTAEGQ